jgi:hypothetical protein
MSEESTIEPSGCGSTFRTQWSEDEIARWNGEMTLRFHSGDSGETLRIPVTFESQPIETQTEGTMAEAPAKVGTVGL